MQMVGFMSVAAMAGSGSFIMMVPILMHGFITCGQISTENVQQPFNLILVSPIKNTL
jgi:hypothetical protein